MRILFLFLFLNSVSIYAQGIIKGSVTDSLTADKLKWAESMLAGTTFSAVSGIDGEFNITGIPPGDYIVKGSYVACKERIITV
jgi:hypothetical protein